MTNISHTVDWRTDYPTSIGASNIVMATSQRDLLTSTGSQHSGLFMEGGVDSKELIDKHLASE